MAQQPPSFFSSAAFDHAAAGIGAGTVAVLCMNPLDLLKVKLQVATTKPAGGIGKQIWYSLRDIQKQDGWKGLYRGVGANIAGNASSWGLYFFFYNVLKKRASEQNSSVPLSSSTILLCAAQASAVTAIMTNPIWVVKVRMFTTRPDAPNAYRGVFHGLSSIFRAEGVSGLFRGTSLALVGVSNGAIQFVVYERMKRWGFDLKKKQFALAGKEWTPEVDKLSNTAYSAMSGGSKIAALALTYPYQVVRSRLQNNATTHLYPDIPATIRRTWAQEGLRGFYRGLGTNLVRVLPGTCVTFVVYENIAWLLRTTAAKRDRRRQLEAER
ncbi:mitochondrial carrier domain-containing protein [Mycena amicta]|nr:mitochondrial carrier domain-containing protein [Mycena amicta]